MNQPSAADGRSRSQRIALMRHSLALLPGVDCQRVRVWVPREGRLVLVEDERDAVRDSPGET